MFRLPSGLVLLVLALLGLVCQTALARDPMVEFAVFDDPGGVLTPEQARRAEFVPTGQIVSRGYVGGALWVRLGVTGSDGAGRLALRVFPAQVEEVRLFSSRLPSTGLRIVERTTWIDAGPGPEVYYLRVRTSGPMLLQPRLLTEAQARRDDTSRGFILGILLTAYVPLLLWLLVLIATRREGLHVALLLNLSVVVASFLGWMGFPPEVLGPGHWASLPAAIHFLGVINVFTGFLCVALVLDRFGLPRWGKRLFAFLGVLYVPLFLLFFVQDRQVVLQCSTGLGLLASLLGLPLTVAVFHRQKAGNRLIGVVMFIAMALGLRWFLTVYTLMPTPDSLTGLLVFRLVFAMSFVSAILWLIDREKQSQLQLSRTNEIVARRLAESETLRREAQERFMTMLMHEIKTPLAIIQLAAGSLGRHLAPDGADATRIRNINRSVDDLNDLVERCVATDRIDQGALPMHKRPLCLATLTEEVLRGFDAGRVTLLGPTGHTVFSDPQFLRLILLNLLGNALKYSPPESPVELRFEPAVVADVAGVSLRIGNAAGAAGMPDPARVFSRYYRAEGARAKVGAGLGLWLAQTLAGQLGTELHYRSENDRVDFCFFLEYA